MSVDAYKLLIDENLSPRLVGLLSEVFPGSTHVRDVGLKGRSDDQIWIYAASHGYTILTKDDDFRSMSLLRGPPQGDLVGCWQPEYGGDSAACSGRYGCHSTFPHRSTTCPEIGRAHV